MASMGEYPRRPGREPGPDAGCEPMACFPEPRGTSAVAGLADAQPGGGPVGEVISGDKFDSERFAALDSKRLSARERRSRP
jgi:hypothetical protein